MKAYISSYELSYRNHCLYKKEVKASEIVAPSKALKNKNALRAIKKQVRQKLKYDSNQEL